MDERPVAVQELAQLEILCEAFYGGDPDTQRDAHNVLLPLLSNASNTSKLHSILANSNQPQALLFACSGLSKLFTQHWCQIPESEKFSLRDFLLNYLYARGPEMLAKAPVIVGHFVRLLCRIIKLMWLENVSHQSFVENVRMFIKGNTTQWVLGLEIYAALVEDMQPSHGPQLPRHRRTAISFRDTSLSDILKVAIDTISQFLSGTIQVPANDETRLLNRVLKLTNNCLSFDYMGTVPDDTTDEQGTVMVPQTWVFLKELNIPNMFFDLYDKCSEPPRMDCARMCLSALVYVAALRRSFFNKEEQRRVFLGQLVTGTAKLISSGRGLDDDGCYHELCRLVGRINASNQLSELLESKQFATWLNELFSFTIRSLEDWSRLPNSKHYLLGVWSHMVNPVMFLKSRAPPAIAEYIHQVTCNYIDSRMKLAEAVALDTLDGDFENPLTHEVLRTEQLEVLSHLGRCRYQAVAQKVSKLFSDCQNDLQNGNIPEAVFQEKITWLIYMVGALIGGNNSAITGTSAAEDSEANGTLSTNVFKFIEETNKFPASSEGFELAYLHFLDQFRKVYVSEHSKIATQADCPATLAQCLGLPDDDAILDLLINKIGFNLQQRSESEQIVKKTLALFYDLANGISIVQCSDRSPHLIVSAKLLLKNKTVRYILERHADETFRFLSIAKYGKYRTSYYLVLGKLTFMEIRDNTQKFVDFLAPQTAVFSMLWNAASAGNSIKDLKTEECKKPLIGLVRDLRGICTACNAAEPYMLMFNWLVNDPTEPSKCRIHLFTWAADVWWDDEKVIIPLLKFISEFVHNKAQRITFDSSSANGILLFKEVSSILLSYGTRILERTHFTNFYQQKYKGIAVALKMFCHTLSGNYVNYGVFDLYGDGALNDALRLALQMCLAIPDQDLLAYTKSLKSYYQYLDLVTRTFMPQVLLLPFENLQNLLRSLEEGLCSFESGVCMQCCTTLDNLVTYFYNNRKDDSKNQAINRILTTEPRPLGRIFQLLFQLVLGGEYSSTWSMSRPLLGLILLHEQDFAQIKSQLIAQQQDKEKREKIASSFTDLMKLVTDSLNNKNKDIFTRNLYHFSSVIRTILV